MSAPEILEGFDDDDSPHTSLRSALDDALRTTPLLARDVAAVALARHYASMLDDATDRLSEAADDDEARDFMRYATVVAKIGPRFEATLDKLGMSPGARPAVRGGEPSGVDPSSAALAALQSGSPAAGVDYAASVDPAVTEADSGD